MSRKLIDLTGKRFGRLTVIQQAGFNKWEQRLWLCKCDCGTEKNIGANSLRVGDAKSCGCLRKDAPNNRKRLSPGLANMRSAMRAYKKRAKARGLEFNLTEKQFAEITQKDCYYCGSKPNNISKDKGRYGVYIYNGVDRIDNNKGYTIDNIVPCCFLCNERKKAMTLQEFQDWVEKVYNNMFNNKRRPHNMI